MIKFAPHESDAPLLSTIGTLREADLNFLWIDVRNFLLARIQDHLGVLESSDDMKTIIRSQAIIGNCRDIIALPNLFITELEENAE